MASSSEIIAMARKNISNQQLLCQQAVDSHFRRFVEKIKEGNLLVCLEFDPVWREDKQFIKLLKNKIKSIETITEIKACSFKKEYFHITKYGTGLRIKFIERFFRKIKTESKQEEMFNYTLSSDCLENILKLINILTKDQSIGRFVIENSSVFVFSFDSSLTKQQLISILNQIENSEYMSETIELSEEYTGERKYIDF